MGSETRLYAMALDSGKRFDLTVPDMTDLPQMLEKACEANQISADDTLVLSDSPRAEPPAPAEAAPTAPRLLTADEPGAAPPVPVPSSYNDYPQPSPTPQPAKLVKTVEVAPTDFYVSMNFGGKRLAMVPLSGLTYKPYRPPFPQPHLRYSRYWDLLFSTQVANQGSASHSIQTTVGSSKSETSSWSATVGVSYGALSASLSHKLSTTITVSDSKTIENQFQSGDAPHCGIFNVWQLVELLEWVDDEGQLIYLERRDSSDPFRAMSANVITNTMTNRTVSYSSPTYLFDSGCQ